MNHKYLFQLGNYVNLSISELQNRLVSFKKSEYLGNNFLTADIQVDDAQRLIDTLGGLIRICKVIHFEQKPLGNEAILKLCREFLAHNLNKEGKNPVGVSCFPQNNTLIRKSYDLKKALKKDFSIRLINRDFKNLDAGTLHKEKVFKKGVEIVIFKSEKCTIIAHTVAAQDIDKLSKRDYEKPVRDMNVGMLPIKLADMMINLAAENGKLPDSIWDPFCGTGTILSEAAFMGIEKLYGSDISQDRIDDTKNNLSYFINNSKFQIQNSKFETFKHDAGGILQKPIDAEAIITETYLGPIFSKPLSDFEIAQTENEVSFILENFFNNLHKNFTGKKCVIALPFWQMANGKNYFLKKPLEIAAKFWQTAQGPIFDTTRNSFLYKRPQQVVGREIFVLNRA